MTEFIANTVVIDDSDDEFMLVGFANELDGEYLDAIHFQRSCEFDEQDVLLGMNEVYIERGNQAGGAYGGINSVDLYADRIRIVTSGRAAESLGDTEFMIHFTVTEDKLRRLQHGLRTVFNGFALFTEHFA
jgi:hypothetical protein